MDDPERLRNLREELLRADAEVSAFFASSRDLVCELDADGLFKRLNARWQVQLGFALDELRGRLWTEFVHSDDLAVTQDALAELEVVDTIQFENRVRHSNGTFRSLRWTATRWHSANVILAVAIDATQRHEDERAFHELHRFENQVIASAHEGIVVIDRDLRFVIWNPFMERISGLKAERVLGRCVSEIFPVPFDQGEYDLVQRALAGESDISQDLRYNRSPIEGDVWISVHFSPYRSAEEVIIGVIAFVDEITDRKRLEKELRLARHEPGFDQQERSFDTENPYGLTARERTTLSLVAAGKSNKEIARDLTISPVTVSSHVASILRKMHAASRAEAAARAVRESLVN